MNRLRYGFRSFGLELVMIAVAIGFLFPLYVLVSISLKRPTDVASSPLGPPTEMFLANYGEAWAEASLGRALFNSTVVTTLNVLALVVLGSLAAYWLARRKQRLSYVVYMLFVLGLMLPLQLGMIPLYQLMRDLGILNTYTSLILFSTGAHLPLTIFLYTGFLRALPREYEEAALVDGATPRQAFIRIVFPLLRPITGTVIILNAISAWNDFLTPLLYVGGTRLETLPVAIFSFRGEYTADWGVMFAGLVIAIIPILIVYFLLQRYIIRGFASGLKG